MKFLSYDTPLMQFLAKAADLMLLNILFVVCSLPVFTAGAAATAMYSVLFKLEEGKETAVVLPFLRAFKAEFGKATVLFLALLLPGILAGFGLYVLIRQPETASLGTTVLLLIPAVLYLFLVTYAFPLNAKFDAPVAQTVKNAFVLSVANLPVTIPTAILNALPVIMLLAMPDVFLKWLIIWALIGLSLTAWVNRMLLDRIFRKFY